MALRDHLALKGQLDGNRQIKVQSWTVNFNSGAQVVNTLEGFAGKTPGSGNIEINGTWAVETGGFESNFWDYCQEGSYHEFQFPIGDKTIVSQGYFESGSVGQNTDASTEASAVFRGEFQKLQ